ncbi:MAG: hypothetical protein AB7S26_39905 [Sandaracinaceae bacterium]
MRCSLGALALALGLAACGADAPHPAPRAHARTMPATDHDPLPYTPSPTERGRAGAPVALAAAGGEDQARRMLPAFLTAIRDADERELARLLSEELAVVQAQRGRGVAQSRATLIQRVLVYAQRSLVPTDAAVEELVDLENLEVRRARELWHDALPEGLLATDLVIEVRPLDAGRTALRILLGWGVTGRLVVRPGREPRIVAL